MTKEKLRKGECYVILRSNLCYSYMLAGDEVIFDDFRKNVIDLEAYYFKPLKRRGHEELQYLYEDALVHVVPSGKLAKALYGLS